MLPPNALNGMLPAERLMLADGPMVYRSAGTGAPLLLLHGWGGSSRYWHATLTDLSDIRSIYAPDLPGFAGTPPPTGRASAAELARRILAFADALGLERFDVVGHSFGAGVAAYLAALHPERVTRLVLTCFGTPRTPAEHCFFMQSHLQYELSLSLWEPWLRLWRPVQQLARPYLIWQWSQPPLPQILASRFFYRIPTSEQMLYEGLADLVGMDLITSLQAASSVGDPALLAALRTITAPTLVLGAEHDQIMPPAGIYAAAALVPGSSVGIVKRCGHVPMIERPVEFNSLLRTFLS